MRFFIPITAAILGMSVPIAAKDLNAKLSPGLQTQAQCVAWSIIVEQEREGVKKAWPEFPDTSGNAQILAQQLASQIAAATDATEPDIRSYFRDLVEEVQNIAYSDKVGEFGQPLDNPDALKQYEALSNKCTPIISKMIAQ